MQVHSYNHRHNNNPIILYAILILFILFILFYIILLMYINILITRVCLLELEVYLKLIYVES